MKRRDFLGSVVATGVAAPALAAQGHDHGPVNGVLANATVSFGQWQSDPPFDRFPNNNDRTRNSHMLIPNTAVVKARGSVTFVIAGFHQVIVYGPGKRPDEVASGQTVPVTAPPGPPLINDPAGRIYRGLDPSLYPQDRVEVVQFSNPGLHLVICGVQPHFVNDGMFGWVWVVR
jgi:hypothetical protein